MSLGTLFSYPYFLGTGTSSEVPGKYPIGINGTGYFLDEQAFAELEARATIPVLRTQADQSNVPGLQSLNPEDLWRRDVESWHHGAGQAALDRENTEQSSDPARFRSSKGVDVWTKWQLSLLPATQQALSSANTNLRLAATDSRLYVTDGTALKYTSSVTAGPPASWTSVTSYSATAASSIASDGFKVYTANGSDGCYRTDTSTGAATKFVTTAVATDAVMGVAKARLMLGTSNSLYNITDLAGPAALPTALFTHQNTAWKWVGFAEGPNSIYAAGYAGDKSYIYRTGIKQDATGLDAPVVAGELPDGEVVRSIQGYLGFLLVGTDKGVRLAALDSAGNLQFGRLVSTSSSVLCFEPQDRFVWFGWTNYDATSTGLGRIDLSVFTEPLVPAYASDLMVTAQATVQSVVTFGTVRVFTVSGSGVWTESTSKVSSGTLDSGVLSYGLVDDKIATFVDVRHLTVPAGASIDVSLATDGDSFTDLGSDVNTTTLTTFNANEARGETFELRLTLARATDTTTGPTVKRETLRSFPSVRRSQQFLVPILLAEQHAGAGGGSDVYLQNVAVARQELFDLALSPQILVYQEGFESWSVLCKDVTWRPTHLGSTGWNGTVVLKLVSVEE